LRQREGERDREGSERERKKQGYVERQCGCE